MTTVGQIGGMNYGAYGASVSPQVAKIPFRGETNSAFAPNKKEEESHTTRNVLLGLGALIIGGLVYKYTHKGGKVFHKIGNKVGKKVARTRDESSSLVDGLPKDIFKSQPKNDTPVTQELIDRYTPKDTPNITPKTTPKADDSGSILLLNEGQGSKGAAKRAEKANLLNQHTINPDVICLESKAAGNVEPSVAQTLSKLNQATGEAMLKERGIDAEKILGSIKNSGIEKEAKKSLNDACENLSSKTGITIDKLKRKLSNDKGVDALYDQFEGNVDNSRLLSEVLNRKYAVDFLGQLTKALKQGEVSDYHAYNLLNSYKNSDLQEMYGLKKSLNSVITPKS